MTDELRARTVFPLHRGEACEDLARPRTACAASTEIARMEADVVLGSIHRATRVGQQPATTARASSALRRERVDDRFLPSTMVAHELPQVVSRSSPCSNN